MTFQAAMSWLFEQLPMYQRDGAAAYKTDLDGTWAVLESMGRPDLKLPNVIHVAGTNGKGSVCQAVHNALVDQGFKVGLFTSPHLHDFRERMQGEWGYALGRLGGRFCHGAAKGVRNAGFETVFF
jgi:dihydrofolate synthase/folylpolyglutamate synthase